MGGRAERSSVLTGPTERAELVAPSWSRPAGPYEHGKNFMTQLPWLVVAGWLLSADRRNQAPSP
jgi:hypothetical protein